VLMRVFSRELVSIYIFVNLCLANTPGPGTYMLPSEFGRIAGPKRAGSRMRFLDSQEGTEFSTMSMTPHARTMVSEMEKRGRQTSTAEHESMAFMQNPAEQYSLPVSRHRDVNDRIGLSPKHRAMRKVPVHFD
jgi:hypothetical protein